MRNSTSPKMRRSSLIIFQVTYRKAVSFRHGASQQEILTSTKWEGVDRSQEVQDYLAEHPDVDFHLFDENPLDFGCFLDTITSKDEYFSFVGKVNCQTGIVLYKQPEKDSCFTVWTGCYACSHQEKALLCCVAINGYHSCVVYEWRSTERLLFERSPIFYCGKVGKYTCTVKRIHSEQKEDREFNVFRHSDGQFCVSAQDFLGTSDSEANGESRDVEDMGVVVEDLQHSNKDTDCCEVSVCHEGSAEPSTDSSVNQSSLHFGKNTNEICAIKESLQNPDDLLLLDIIGQGSFGKVHKAVWRGTFVAAKVIPMGNEKSLENELSVYRSLQHPHMLSLLGVKYHEGSTVLIMNLVDGQDLSTLLFGNKKRTFTFFEKVTIMKQICQAMVFMHQCQPHPILHLDLKPANVLVVPNSLHVYVADFGVATMKAGTRRTTQCKAGTPGFQSPEQLEGKNIGTHSDVYAFGCIAFELFNEKPIWEGLSAHTIMFRVGVQREYPPLFCTDQRVSQILACCFKEAAVRGTAIDLLSLLCDIILSAS